MVLIILSQFLVFQYINHITSEQKTKNVNVYKQGTSREAWTLD